MAVGGWLARRLGSRLGSWARLALVYTLLVPVVVEPQIKSFEGGEICLTDLVEVMVVGEVWDLDSEVALPPGLMLVWEEEDCRGVGTSSVEQPVYLGHGQCRRLKPIGKQCSQDKHPTPLTERQLLLLEQHLLLPR